MKIAYNKSVVKIVSFPWGVRDKDIFITNIFNMGAQSLQTACTPKFIWETHKLAGSTHLRKQVVNIPKHGTMGTTIIIKPKLLSFGFFNIYGYSHTKNYSAAVVIRTVELASSHSTFAPVLSATNLIGTSVLSLIITGETSKSYLPPLI